MIVGAAPAQRSELEALTIPAHYEQLQVQPLDVSVWCLGSTRTTGAQQELLLKQL